MLLGRYFQIDHFVIAFGSRSAISRHSAARSLHSLDVIIGYSPNRTKTHQYHKTLEPVPGLPSCISVKPQLKREWSPGLKIRLLSREFVRAFKGIICDDVSEFESYMPSHAVGLSQVRDAKRYGGRRSKRPAAMQASQCTIQKPRLHQYGRARQVCVAQRRRPRLIVEVARLWTVPLFA